MSEQDIVQFTFTGESFNPDAFKGGVIINGARYTPAPDTHGHASVEDWLVKNYRIEVGYSYGRPGWTFSVDQEWTGYFYPTYPAARTAAVAWVEGRR